MPEIEVLLSFFLASVVIGLAPGPDNFYVLTQSVVQGRAAGVVITLGLCTGLLVHTAVVALGVATLIMATPLLFHTLKCAGAAYLLFLAYQAFRAAGAEFVLAQRQGLSAWYLYRRGVFMNISNPKVSVFFLAYLPQFVNPEAGQVPAQMIVLGLVFIGATLLVFISIAVLAATLATGLRNSKKAPVILYRITGAVLLLLALRLLFQG